MIHYGSSNSGYKLAEEVDALLNSAIKNCAPSNPNNYMMWLAAIRTIRTSLDIIEANLPALTERRRWEHGEQILEH